MTENGTVTFSVPGESRYGYVLSHRDAGQSDSDLERGYKAERSKA